MLTWRWPLKRPLPFSALCQSRVLLRMGNSPTFSENITDKDHVGCDCNVM